MALRAGKIEFAGARVQIKPSDGAARSIVFLADETNASPIWIGGKTETAEAGKGFPLGPGKAIGIELTDAGQIWAFGGAGDDGYYFLNGNVK